MSYQIHLYTSLAIPTAVTAGSATAGTIAIPLTDAQTADLRDAGLAEVAAPYLDGSERSRERRDTLLAVAGPGWEAAITALRGLIEEREAMRAAVDAACEARDARLLAELAGPDVEVIVTVGLLASGEVAPSYTSHLVSAAVAVFVPPFTELRSGEYARVRGQQVWLTSGPAVDERRAAQVAERNARITAAREKLLPGLRADLARVLAERALESARIRTEYDALYARLPETLRSRHTDGYAPVSEVQSAIAALIRRDAGYLGHDGYQHSSACETLTDEEYEALVAARQTAPEGATVTPLEVYDLERVACDERDEHDEHDGDCDDCTTERRDVRRVARIVWTRGGIEARAHLALSARWGQTEGAMEYAARRHG